MKFTNLPCLSLAVRVPIPHNVKSPDTRREIAGQPNVKSPDNDAWEATPRLASGAPYNLFYNL